MDSLNMKQSTVIKDLQARLQQRWSTLESDSNQSKIVDTPRRSESQEARQRELRSRGPFTPRVADCSEVSSANATPRLLPTTASPRFDFSMKGDLRLPFRWPAPDDVDSPPAAPRGPRDSHPLSERRTYTPRSVTSLGTPREGPFSACLAFKDISLATPRSGSVSEKPQAAGVLPCLVSRDVVKDENTKSPEVNDQQQRKPSDFFRQVSDTSTAASCSPVSMTDAEVSPTSPNSQLQPRMSTLTAVQDDDEMSSDSESDEEADCTQSLQDADVAKESRGPSGATTLSPLRLSLKDLSSSEEELLPDQGTLWDLAQPDVGEDMEAYSLAKLRVISSETELVADEDSPYARVVAVPPLRLDNVTEEVKDAALPAKPASSFLPTTEEEPEVHETSDSGSDWALSPREVHETSVEETPEMPWTPRINEDGQLVFAEEPEKVIADVLPLDIHEGNVEALQRQLPKDIVDKARGRAYFIFCNTGCKDHLRNYFEALSIELHALGVPVAEAQLLVADEEVYKAMRKGLPQDLAARARVRAYFLWKESGCQDANCNFFAALKAEIRFSRERVAA